MIETSNGKFNAAFSKTYMEWVIYHSKGLPGPLDYPAPRLPRAGGGKFNMSRPKSPLDWIEYRAAQTPGPDAYSRFHKMGDGLDRNAGKFSTSRPKTALEQAVFDKRDVPCPTSYSPIKADVIKY